MWITVCAVFIQISDITYIVWLRPRGHNFALPFNAGCRVPKTSSLLGYCLHMFSVLSNVYFLFYRSIFYYVYCKSEPIYIYIYIYYIYIYTYIYIYILIHKFNFQGTQIIDRVFWFLCLYMTGQRHERWNNPMPNLILMKLSSEFHSNCHHCPYSSNNDRYQNSVRVYLTMARIG